MSPVYNNSNSTRWKRKDTRKEFDEKNKPVTITDDDSKGRETIYNDDSREEERKPLRADTMDVPGEVNVYSVGPNDNTSSTKYNKPVELSGTYKLMSDKGIHFTSYTETLPESGRTYSWSERSGSSFSSSGFNKGRRVPGPMRENGEEGDNETTE